MATMTIGNPTTKMTGLENANYHRTKQHRIHSQSTENLPNHQSQHSHKRKQRDTLQIGNTSQSMMTAYSPASVRNKFNQVANVSLSLGSSIQSNEQLKTVNDDASVKLSFQSQSSNGLSNFSFNVKGDNFEFNLSVEMERKDSLQLITTYNDKEKNGKFDWKALKELLASFEEKSGFSFTVNFEVPLSKKEVIRKHFFGENIQKYMQWKVDYNQSIVASLMVNNQGASTQGSTTNDTRNLARVAEAHSTSKGKKVGHNKPTESAPIESKSNQSQNGNVVEQVDKTPKEHQNTNPQASFNRTA